MKRRPKDSTGAARRPWWATFLRSAPASPAPVPTNDLFLSSTGCFVAVEEALADACLAATVVDDLIWRIALEEWHSRRPERWGLAARRRWLEEYDDLCTQRARITSVARYYGGEPQRG